MRRPRTTPQHSVVLTVNVLLAVDVLLVALLDAYHHAVHQRMAGNATMTQSSTENTTHTNIGFIGAWLLIPALPIPLCVHTLLTNYCLKSVQEGINFVFGIQRCSWKYLSISAGYQSRAPQRNHRWRRCAAHSSAGRLHAQVPQQRACVISLSSRFGAVRIKVTYQDFLYRSGNSLRAARSAAQGTCTSFCEAGDAARCLNCPGDPMWLLAPRV